MTSRFQPNIVGCFGGAVKDDHGGAYPVALPQFSRYFPPAVAKVYIVSFRSHNDDRPHPDTLSDKASSNRGQKAHCVLYSVGQQKEALMTEANKLGDSEAYVGPGIK